MLVVDFGVILDNLVYIVLYMSCIGLDERVLLLFCEVSVVVLFCFEFYVHGLKVVSWLEDLDGICWVMLGVLW